MRLQGVECFPRCSVTDGHFLFYQFHSQFTLLSKHQTHLWPAGAGWTFWSIIFPSPQPHQLLPAPHQPHQLVASHHPDPLLLGVHHPDLHHDLHLGPHHLPHHPGHLLKEYIPYQYDISKMPECAFGNKQYYNISFCLQDDYYPVWVLSDQISHHFQYNEGND